MNGGLIRFGARGLAGIGLAVLWMAGPAATAQDKAGEAAFARVDEAAKKAVAYLLKQQKGEGFIHDRDHNKTAMTALSIMAMLSVGHQPTDQTPEGEALRKALGYVLDDKRMDENGYFGSRDGSRMYGHGIITLMLAEMLGMGVDADMDRRIRDRLTKAIRLILNAQNRKRPDNVEHFGGWRYQDDSGDSDLSVTIWQLLALRAAKNDDFPVPSEAIENAIRYLKKCFRVPPDRKRKQGSDDGACAYQPNRSPSYASAAAGLLAMQVCGLYEADEVKQSADWLLEKKFDYNQEYFFYGTYYYAQGMYQRGGEHADAARRRVEDLLLPKQNAEGWWEAHGGQERDAGKVYATSMAVLSLSVRHHYLPIYQR